MCGIVVMLGAQGEVQMEDMLSRIKHRGPDGSGILQMGDYVLGHVRLSILDVQGGAQPMTNEKGDLALSFNGEIYNYLDLRQNLENRHKFQTRSDSEVLLHLYEEDHEDMLSQLDGMFAIALASSRGLLLARDPIGIKPLYYGKKGDLFIAASELKVFPEMDEIKMLPAGYAMYVGEEPWCFAKPFPPHNPLITQSTDEILKEIRRRLDAAVEKRLMSDVPVGVYLSGGLDSSLVTALMRPHTVHLHSFTAGMEGAPDLESARTIARFLDTEHHELIYTADDVANAIPEVIHALESFDAPLVRSAVPMYFVSKLAARFVKVVLSGEGADELFAGYSYLGKIKDRTRLRKELADSTLRLQDTNLQRADRVSMAHSLEARVPFLDMDLVRYVSRLPIELLEQRSDRPEKWLLREACRGLLPPKILDRKKMKFSEGAGSSEVIAELVKNKISQEKFMKEKEVEPGLFLRSPEELYYYRIWRDVMEPHITINLVGRTLDRSAASGV